MHLGNYVGASQETGWLKLGQGTLGLQVGGAGMHADLGAGYGVTAGVRDIYYQGLEAD